MLRQTVSSILLSAVALACAAGAAQAQAVAEPAASVDPRVGPYVAGAIGRSEYDHACFFFSTCDSSRATTGRLAAGYRFGVVALEAAWTDFGEGRGDLTGATQRLRALGLSAVFLLRWGQSLEGLLRVGAASVQDSRSLGNVATRSTRTQPTFGLGLGWVLTPAVSLQLGWDVTLGDTNSNSSISSSSNSSNSSNDGTVIVNATTLGLRVRF